MIDRWWTKSEPFPGRGIIPRKINPYKGNTVNSKNNDPSSWKILEMKKIRNIVRNEILSVLSETTTANVAGFQDGDPDKNMDENITALTELKELYEKLNSYIFDDISRASSFASQLSEYLLDEGNFELRNFHGHETVKRNAKHLTKLSEELQKTTDMMNVSRRQALAIVDEIGMIAYRYDNKNNR